MDRWTGPLPNVITKRKRTSTARSPESRWNEERMLANKRREIKKNGGKIRGKKRRKKNMKKEKKTLFSIPSYAMSVNSVRFDLCASPPFCSKVFSQFHPEMTESESKHSVMNKWQIALHTCRSNSPFSSFVEHLNLSHLSHLFCCT